MTESMNRDFKGIWIPREMWLDNRLSYFEKLLFAEIDSLDCGDEHCFASNAYFAKFFVCTERTVVSAITKLKNLGMVEVYSFDGRTRRLLSNLKSCYIKSEPKSKHSPRKSKNNILQVCPAVEKLDLKKISGLPREKFQVAPIGDFIERDNKDYNKDKKDHPSYLPSKRPPKPKEDPPKTKSGWLVGFLKLGYSEEEFEYAWNEYLGTKKGQVKHLEEWLLKVIERIRTEQAARSERSIEAEIHAKDAKELERKYPKKYGASPDHLYIYNTNNFNETVKVAYDVSEKEWERNLRMYGALDELP